MVQIRRSSMYELQVFKNRWEGAVEEDKEWVDPVEAINQRRKQIQKLQVKFPQS